MSDCLFLVGINFSVSPLSICQILLVIMAKILFDILSKLAISTSFFQKFLGEGVQWPPSPNPTPFEAITFLPLAKFQMASLIQESHYFFFTTTPLTMPFPA